MTRLSSWVLALWLASPLPALADVLQLDMVLFAQPPWITKRDQGQWDYQTPPPATRVDPAQAEQDGTARLIPTEQGGLAQEVQRLEAEGYTVLDQLSLQFEQTRNADAVHWQIQAGEPLLVEPSLAVSGDQLMGSQWYEESLSRQMQTHFAVDGWVRAWVDRYLFVEFDIGQFVGNTQRLEELRTRSAAWQSASDFSQSLSSSPYNSPFGNAGPAPAVGAVSTVDVWPAEAVDLYRLQERKRVRLNELHYFDHPRIGMLIQITEPKTSPLLEPES